MKLIVGRILSTLLMAGGWLLAGVRTVLDLIGYSTAPEDVGIAQARLDQFLGWLLSIPWWAVWGFALISTLWLIWVSWPRQAAPTSAPPASNDAARAEKNEPEIEDISGKEFRQEHVHIDNKRSLIAAL